MHRHFKIFFFSVSLFCAFHCVTAQKYSLNELFEAKRLSVFNRTVTRSENAIVLNEDFGDGVVWLNDVNFTTGIIEADVKGQDVFQHSFVGIAFHGLNDSAFDAVYFRPFNFRTDDSTRRAHGVQYISLPEFNWKKLRAEQNGKFEHRVQPAPDPNEWFRMRIRITDSEVIAFVNGESEPCLRVPLLNQHKSGRIGLYTADRSGGAFRNLLLKAD